ncbi:L-aspartate oxidase [Halegenticoccus soli]|uniref:L-aspartate oxidase n=1 Tax=Halegenticoccus soli TaxID=1985678 RepID=UPI000C6D82A9|nr:FAD-dependent oxidoreductase [Halegenticoccus soli]
MRCDVLIVGSGIAGCSAAFAAAAEGADVAVITKATKPADAASDRAQGGVATTRTSPASLKRDVLRASAGTADENAVDVLVEDAASAIDDVLHGTLSVPFDTTDGGYDFGREAAHSEARILRVDAETGRHVLRPFLSRIEDDERIAVREGTAAIDLIVRDGRVHGAVVERDREVERVYAGATILATGGVGSVYRRTTNPAGATGDGIAMAALAGAAVADMEFVQFHPTAYDDDSSFLVSEAVRGEGAVLRNGRGERFMPNYHRDAELAPRDVVARAVDRERGETDAVVLDVSTIDFRERFPGLAEACDERGVDLPSIPVAPAEHFLCGGIAVDDVGRTSLGQLFAAGECARTGVHGANRLASTSLLEGLVWGLRAGEAAAGRSPKTIERPLPLDRDPELPEAFVREKFDRLRGVMDEHAWITRTPRGLRIAERTLRRLKGEVDAYARTRTAQEFYELRNACVTALLIVRAAGDNPNSVGCHHVDRKREPHGHQ